ncbi:MAG: DUF2339 domain-containing protein [Verrucomicrobiota bacterium]
MNTTTPDSSAGGDPGDEGHLSSLRREQALLRERLAALEQSPQLEDYLRQIAELRTQIDAFDLRLASLANHSQPATKLSPAPAKTSAKPPPLPPVRKAVIAPAAKTPVAVTRKETPKSKPAPAKAEEPSAGLEITFGRYWLSRIGIVMLLTGFVFLATYLGRKMFEEDISPWVRTGVLYLGSFSLLGAGLWLERWRETLRQYGQVVAAGGMAAVFYTTYAAHYLDKLQIIPNPLVAGVLLLLWTGLMVFIADRRKSEGLALLGILLAYYACLITQATTFSLWSALILAGAALFYVIRNRWLTIGFVSLVGTYGAYAYWRFFAPHTGAIEGLSFDRGDFWPASIFLICYWIVFSLAALPPFAAKTFSLKPRTTFAGLNNTAFLALFAIGMLPHYQSELWLFATVMGGVFLAIWVYLLERLPWGKRDDEPDSDTGRDVFASMFLLKGLTLITLGATMKLSGPSLALTLAVESVALLVMGNLMNHRLLKGGAFCVAALSVIETVLTETGTSLLAFSPTWERGAEGMPLGVVSIQAMCLLAAGWWIGRRNRNALALKPRATASVFDPGASFFVSGALAAFLVGGVDDLAAPWRAFVPAVLAALMMVAGSERFLRYREAAWMSPILLGVAGFFLWDRMMSGETALWADLGVFTILLGMEAWCRFGAIPERVKETKWPAIVGGISAVAFVIGLVPWLTIEFEVGDSWLYLGGFLALTLFAYGIAVRSKLLTASSLLYHVMAVATLVGRGLYGSIDDARYWPLLFLIGHIVLIECADRLPIVAGRLTVKRERLATIGLLGLDLLAVLAAWYLTAEYVDRGWEPIVMFAGGAVALVSTRRVLDHRIATSFALAFVGAGMLALQLTQSPAETMPLYVGILGLLGFQQLYRFFGAPERMTPGGIGMFSQATGTANRELAYQSLQWITALAGTGALWALVSIDVNVRLITVSWAVLAFALFALGLALKERPYRYVSLGLLAAALLRVMTIDVWKLEAVPRILSFIAIGLVLLALGFVYNRFQESLKRYF